MTNGNIETGNFVWKILFIITLTIMILFYFLYKSQYFYTFKNKERFIRLYEQTFKTMKKLPKESQNVNIVYKSLFIFSHFILDLSQCFKFKLLVFYILVLFKQVMLCQSIFLSQSTLYIILLM